KNRQHSFKHRKVCVVFGDIAVTLDTTTVIHELRLQTLQILPQRRGFVLLRRFFFGGLGFFRFGTGSIEDIFDLGQRVSLLCCSLVIGIRGILCWLVAELTGFGVDTPLIGKANRVLLFLDRKSVV